MVVAFRATDTATPIVLMGYANPIEAMGTAAFAERARAAGVDGVLVVDYPPEEASEFATLLGARDIAPIFLLSPTTPEHRIAAVAKIARGYVYYVSLKGVTGAGHLDTADVARKLAEIRRHVALPVGVGFGIRDAASAQAIAARRRRGRHRQPHHPGDRGGAGRRSTGTRRRMARRHPQRARLDAEARRVARYASFDTGGQPDELAAEAAAAADQEHAGRAQDARCPRVCGSSARRARRCSIGPISRRISSSARSAHSTRAFPRASASSSCSIPKAASRSAPRSCRSTASSSRTRRNIRSGSPPRSRRPARPTRWS